MSISGNILIIFIMQMVSSFTHNLNYSINRISAIVVMAGGGLLIRRCIGAHLGLLFSSAGRNFLISLQNATVEGGRL